MANFLFSIAPIFVIIVLGHLLRRGGIPNIAFWNLNDKLVYWVLMPSLLFYKTSTIDLSADFLGPYALVILGGFFVAGVVGLLSAKIFRLENPLASSVFQGSARHNTFIALAVAESVFGFDGLALAALTTAILIPVTNISLVIVLVLLHPAENDRNIVGSILRELVRNPILISVLLGTGVNLLGTGEIPVLHDVTRTIGAAALPIVLMCVGANIRIRAMQAAAVPLALSIATKMIVFPVAIVFLAQAVGLSTFETTIALLFGAAPTSSSAYTVARQMGGDAPVMAAIITIQTAISFITLPLTIDLATRVIG